LGGLWPVQANSARIPHLQNKRARWTGSVAQAVEYLLCKRGVLSSNPSPTKTPLQKPKQANKKIYPLKNPQNHKGTLLSLYIIFK
jgi:hypothetical protein